MAELHVAERVLRATMSAFRCADRCCCSTAIVFFFCGLPAHISDANVGPLAFVIMGNMIGDGVSELPPWAQPLERQDFLYLSAGLGPPFLATCLGMACIGSVAAFSLQGELEACSPIPKLILWSLHTAW